MIVGVKKAYYHRRRHSITIGVRITYDHNKHNNINNNTRNNKHIIIATSKIISIIITVSICTLSSYAYALHNNKRIIIRGLIINIIVRVMICRLSSP